MTSNPIDGAADITTLRFGGDEGDGNTLHELRAAHVAEVLQGLVGLTSDFDKAGAFGDGPPGEVLVRPAREGSFLLEVMRFVIENKDIAVDAGVPSVGTIIWWATRHARAEVADFDRLDNGNVKIKWSDNTAEEVPAAVWEELNKRQPRRKKQLRQIMAPLSDDRVTSLEVEGAAPADEGQDDQPDQYTFDRSDYDAVRPDDEETVEDAHQIFEAEAQLAAIDFENPEKWKVRANGETRTAIVEDEEFLGRIANGLAVRSTDIFRVTIREDVTVKNGQRRRRWVVLKVERFRRASHDNDA